MAVSAATGWAKNISAHRQTRVVLAALGGTWHLSKIGVGHVDRRVKDALVRGALPSDVDHPGRQVGPDDLAFGAYDSGGGQRWLSDPGGNVEYAMALTHAGAAEQLNGHLMPLPFAYLVLVSPPGRAIGSVG
jgi:hypothetical protein